MTFATIIFTIIYHYYDLILLVLLTKSKTEIKINSFCVAQKKKFLCFILKTNADKQTLKQFLQMRFVMDMVTCILAWTKDCGHWLGPGPRQGQEVRRDSPCPVMEPLSWPSGSLRAGRVSCALEPAPGPPPWETTRGHKAWFLTLPKSSFFNCLDYEAPIFTCPSDVFLVFCGMLSSQLLGCARVRLMESPPSKLHPGRSSE